MPQDQAKVVTLRARATQGAGMRTVVHVRQFTLTMDEPEDLGGTDTGANPMEYVLASLAGCASVMLRLIANEQGLQYDSAKFDLRGQLDIRGLEGVPGVCRHFQKVTGTVLVGTDDSAKLVQVAAAVEDRCPVFNMLRDAQVELEVEWRADKA